MNRPEILSPAGNFEKMVAAIRYGADAVYLAGHIFGMRAAADNFSVEELREAVKYAHERDVKVYLTLNTMPRENEYELLRQYLSDLSDICIDAMIIADVGVLNLVKEMLPEMEIHISTQANATSAAACRAWYAMGAKRVVLARELTLDEIKAIRANIPEDLEIECFVHGSMCVSYSGRCLLSNHMVGRDANRGMCAQPCRWNYTIRHYEIEEEKRPDCKMPIEEINGETFSGMIFIKKSLSFYLLKLKNVGNCRQTVVGSRLTAKYARTEIYRHRSRIFTFESLPLGEASLRAYYYGDALFVSGSLEHTLQGYRIASLIAEEGQVMILYSSDQLGKGDGCPDRREGRAAALLRRLVCDSLKSVGLVILLVGTRTLDASLRDEGYHRRYSELDRLLHHRLELVSLRIRHIEGDLNGGLCRASYTLGVGEQALLVTYSCEGTFVIGALAVGYGETVAHRHTQR